MRRIVFTTDVVRHAFGCVFLKNLPKIPNEQKKKIFDNCAHSYFDNLPLPGKKHKLTQINAISHLLQYLHPNWMWKKKIHRYRGPRKKSNERRREISLTDAVIPRHTAARFSFSACNIPANIGWKKFLFLCTHFFLLLCRCVPLLLFLYSHIFQDDICWTAMPKSVP